MKILWFRACDKFHTSQETARNITFNITFSFLLYSLGENRFAYSNELLRFNRKSINPIQKYPHIIESCLYSIFAVIFLFPMKFLISFEICSTPKLSKYITFLAFTYKPIQWVPIDSYPSGFITYAPSLILEKIFLE